jgi:hypothetical protein
MLKPSKEATIQAALWLVPEYTKLLRDLQKDGGRVTFIPEVAIQQKTNGTYVTLYDNELKFGVALFLALLGDAEFKKFSEEIKNASIEEQQSFIDEITNEETLKDFAEMFQVPDTAQGWKVAREQFSALPEEEQLELAKRGAYFWQYFFGSFFNVLAVMVHGEKLTALVPKAINGDDEAFLKAAQTDRMLLLHHPYFIERKLRAQNEGDKNFLYRLANRESVPVLNGRIQFPGLYILFGILESFQWLENLGPTEILDLCEKANLDAYQNRIGDADYVSKRLKEYRRWQNSQRLSRI